MNLGNTKLIEQKATLPNPFDSQLVEYDQGDNEIIIGENAHKTNIDETIGYSSSCTKRPNFPSFLPIVYHNISVEIPQKYSFIVKVSYCNAHSFTYVLLLTMITQFFSGRINSYLVIKWRELLFSFIISIIFPAALFYCQYFPLYFAIRDEKPNSGLILVNFFTIFIFFLMFLGIPGSGSIGIGYLIVTINCGTMLNIILAGIITIWHLFNMIVEVLLLFLVIPINTKSQEISLSDY